jgi:hypothetical protein
VATTFRAKNKALHAAAVRALEEERPMTLRQLYYRLVSAGELNNSQKEYKRLGGVMTRVREAGEVPRSWIVDHVRSTLKPSSWSGLADFADTVREAYRKDFWASLPHHVEVFVEKDAMAGTIQPVTEEYDIRLRVCRGYSSISFAGEVADLWARIKKPIFAYYLGDFDPSGFDLERDLRDKLERYSGIEVVPGNNRKPPSAAAGVVSWVRLAVTPRDFDAFELVRLPAKTGDKRYKAFVREHGDDCAEVDALPPSEVRRRLEEAIRRHIDQERWARLRRTEEAEHNTLQRVVDSWREGNLT